MERVRKWEWNRKKYSCIIQIVFVVKHTRIWRVFRKALIFGNSCEIRYMWRWRVLNIFSGNEREFITYAYRRTHALHKNLRRHQHTHTHSYMYYIFTFRLSEALGVFSFPLPASLYSAYYGFLFISFFFSGAAVTHSHTAHIHHSARLIYWRNS